MQLERLSAKRRNVYEVAVAYIVASWTLSQGIAQVFPVFDIRVLIILGHSVHRVFGARGGCLHSFAGRPILVRLRSAQFETFFDSNDMSQPFGSSRDVIKSRYALLTPDGFVPSALPGWNNCIANIVISSALGAKLAQLLITMEKNGRGEVQKSNLI